MSLFEKKEIKEPQIEKADQELIDKVDDLLEYGYPIKEIAEKTGVTAEFVISNAKKALYLMSDYPPSVRMQELRDKAVWDRVSRTNGTRVEAFEKGKQEGRQQVKFDIARRMLEVDSSVEYVADITGLSLKKISKLRQ